MSASTMDHYGRWEDNREQFHDARDVVSRRLKELAQAEQAVVDAAEELDKKLAHLEKLNAAVSKARAEMSAAAKA